MHAGGSSISVHSRDVIGMHHRSHVTSSDLSDQCEVLSLLESVCDGEVVSLLKWVSDR